MKLYYSEATFKYKTTRPYSIRTRVKGFEITHRYFSLEKTGILHVEPDYHWDGASGPTIDTDDSMAGSLVHDVFFQAMRLGLLPRSVLGLVNKELRRICIAKGMFPPRAQIWYIAVSQCAGGAARKGTEPKERVAP